jgi:hypothetical protein
MDIDMASCGVHFHGKQLQHEGQKEESTSSFLQHLIFPLAHALQTKR